MQSIALYTTIYPGVEKFLKEWYASVRAQTDSDFRLCIGLDALDINTVLTAMDAEPDVSWVMSAHGDTPARLRQKALSRIADDFDAVILVDSDDILHPNRVAAARQMLQTSDLAGCALRLVDEQGNSLGLSLSIPPGVDAGEVLPRHNIYGLSNTAYRSTLLRCCLPIPDDVEIVDWFLATRAWLLGAALAFDEHVRMDYRQHGTNMVCSRPPFSADSVGRETEYVRRHFRRMSSVSVPGAAPERAAGLRRVAADIEVFHERVALKPDILAEYVKALNALDLKPLWWSSVACPLLKYLWT